MQIIRERAFARAGLIGNPSDGYNGRTIAMTIPDFRAEITLYDWPELEIVWSRQDQNLFHSIYDLADDVSLHGYYGGIRLVKATIKRFVEFCTRNAPSASMTNNFSIRYDSNIPRQVGLAGSSGIITATLRALMRFYRRRHPQDTSSRPSSSPWRRRNSAFPPACKTAWPRVYEGVVFMDFSASRS